MSRKLGSLAGLHKSLRKVYSALTLLPGVELSHRTRKELLPGEIVLRTRIASLHGDRDWAFPRGPMVKNLPANAGNSGSIPGSGRSLGEENGNPLQ